MKKALIMKFDESKGPECSKCMVSFSRGDRYHCAGMGTRPICPEDGCRKECPLVDVLPDETDIYRIEPGKE